MYIRQWWFFAFCARTPKKIKWNFYICSVICMHMRERPLKGKYIKLMRHDTKYYGGSASTWYQPAQKKKYLSGYANFTRGNLSFPLYLQRIWINLWKRVCLSSSRAGDHVATDIKIRLRTAKCENTLRIFLRERPVAYPVNVNIALIVQMAARVPNHTVCTKKSGKNLCPVVSKYYHHSITLHF